MELIEKLDDKYVVLKKTDLDKYIGSAGMDRSIFDAICNKINHLREKDGKPQNEYVVLNQDDNISLAHLSGKLTELIHIRMLAHLDEEKGTLHEVKMNPAKVKDIAVDLVNAILRAKDVTAIEDAQEHPSPV